MSLPSVVFVDTSVIVRLIGLDGEQPANAVAAEFERRREAGQRFVLPVTALVEAGNIVVRQTSDRRRFAERLQKVIEEANQPNPPWILHQVTLDQQFADELLAGNSTGSDLVGLLGDGRLGTGDVAILVERDQFKRSVAHATIKVWTFDSELAAHG
ncbi:MAG: hypothetical protein OXE79_09780 [Acidimicrobiaceae bacterium]|nr:hypothetical protein [Acidimicrobiaceae bacterium]MCY4175162.1 hypothetical protein [Acidimicrobiaceae bacterium]MCY4281198.1 hypothetical protein [Acidimicrobiaceae bacterium]MCY4294064.1 hypothetical protein [Acidimicrobiaceae bacterium]